MEGLSHRSHSWIILSVSNGKLNGKPGRGRIPRDIKPRKDTAYWTDGELEELLGRPVGTAKPKEPEEFEEAPDDYAAVCTPLPAASTPTSTKKAKLPDTAKNGKSLHAELDRIRHSRLIGLLQGWIVPDGYPTGNTLLDGEGHPRHARGVLLYDRIMAAAKTVEAGILASYVAWWHSSGGIGSQAAKESKREDKDYHRSHAQCLSCPVHA